MCRGRLSCISSPATSVTFDVGNGKNNDAAYDNTGSSCDNWMKESEATGHLYESYQPIVVGGTCRACAPEIAPCR